MPTCHSSVLTASTCHTTVPLKFKKPGTISSVPICHAPALTGFTAQIKSSILECVEQRRDNVTGWTTHIKSSFSRCVEQRREETSSSDKESDNQGHSRGNRNSILKLIASAWQDSVEAVQETCEAGQETLSKSIYDSFEPLEVLAGPEILHKSLDRYID